MADKHLVVGIDWAGPYDLEGAETAARNDYWGGLYLCIGKLPGRHDAQMQYVGKSSKNLHLRMSKEHHKLSLVTREQEIWLGEIVTGDVPGRRKRLSRESERLGEWALAYFLKMPLNEKLRVSPPPRPVTVLNRWWQQDYETPRIHRPHGSWPDLIDYRGAPYDTRLVWFGAPGLRVVPHDA